jgi:hypothetical protein
MPQSGVDLASIFQAVTQSLQQNQQALNQADTYNQDHGSNMVQTFQTITNALEKKQGSPASTALAYAAKTLAKSTSSGSGQLYVQNLSQAASQFKGQSLDAQGAMQLLQTLIGSGQAGSQGAGGDALGALLGGLAGGGAATQQPAEAGSADMLGALLGGLGGETAPAQGAPAAGGGDMLGSLLGALTGGETASVGGQQGSGVDLQDLLAGGMAFMQAKQQGQGTVPALVQAFMAGSGMGDASHRNQSTQIVVQSFLQALGGKGR